MAKEIERTPIIHPVAEQKQQKEKESRNLITLQPECKKNNSNMN